MEGESLGPCSCHRANGHGFPIPCAPPCRLESGITVSLVRLSSSLEFLWRIERYSEFDAAMVRLAHVSKVFVEGHAVHSATSLVAVCKARNIR